MSTNDLRGYYLKVWYGLVQDRKMSSEEADRVCDKYQQIIIDGYESGKGPAKIADQLATQDKREAHEPGTKWSAEIVVAFNGEKDPNDKWVEDYEGQSVWDFFDDLSDTLPPDEAIECVPDRYMDAFRDYCAYYRMSMPGERKKEGRESKSESALNRITMKDARKALDKLQKDGSLDNVLKEITSLNSFVGNYLANNDSDIKDNKLNSPERKIVARAVLARLVEQFGYQPEDLR